MREMEGGKEKERVGGEEEEGEEAVRRGIRETAKERRKAEKKERKGRGKREKSDCRTQYLLKLFFINMREQLTNFPILPSSSEFTLVAKSLQLKTVS